MRILVICQYYFPEPFRIADICEELVKRGNSVTVVTGLPNYPEGKIYPGYRYGKKRDETINGVRIHRCFTIGRRQGAIFRFLNYYSFAWSSKRYVKHLKDEYDLVFVNQLSPVMMANAGIAYRNKFHKKLILYCLDLWPESLVTGGIGRGSFLYRHFHNISKKIYSQADLIYVTSSMFSVYFQNEFGIESTKYLPQYSEDIFNPEICKKEKNGTVDLMFAGNIGKMQSVDTIIEAARLTKQEKTIRWHIVGDGSDLDRIKKEAGDLENVIFHGRQALEDMPKYYAMADAMLVTMKKENIISYTLPGKVQTYLAAGKPILGAIDGEAQTVIRNAGCGLCGEAEDAAQLAENAIQFAKMNQADQFAQNALQYYKRYFSKDTFFYHLEKDIDSIKNKFFRD